MLEAARQNRIPGLDGMRAIAIVMVLFCHLSSTVNLPEVPGLKTLAAAGIEGVTVFFFLSGYLITWLLLKEEQKHGRFSLPDFYFRRAVRILPASFAFLAVLGVVAWWLQWPVSVRELLSSAFFVRNLVSGSDHTGHYWTLATEEQFYLFWPALLQALPKRWRLPILAGLTLVAPLSRWLLAATGGDPGWFNWWRLFRANALLGGALLALLLDRGVFQSRRPGWILSLAAIGFLGALAVPPGAPPLARVAAYFLELVSIGAALVVLVGGHCTGVQAFLNCAPVVYLGRLSYSLYLWQQLFCLRITGRAHETFPLNLLAACLLAVFSYHLVEKPCLEHRHVWRKWLGAFWKRSPQRSEPSQ